MTAPSNDNRGSACPICARPSVQGHRPFCSQRCRDVDLGRWLDGKYAIPSVGDPDEVDMEALIDAATPQSDPGED